MISPCTPRIARASSKDHSANNEVLVVDRFPSNNPVAEGRYGRYQVVDGRNGNPASSPDTIYPQVPIIGASTHSKSFQWKTFHDTGEETCCGKGWVRKFADGGHDWKNFKRLSLDVENFNCLNYSSEIQEKIPSFRTEFQLHQRL